MKWLFSHENELMPNFCSLHAAPMVPGSLSEVLGSPAHLLARCAITLAAELA